MSVGKRTRPLARRRGLARAGRIKPVNRKRRQSEFARCYHSKARVAWVKAQPCILAGKHQCTGPIDNAHVETGGMGYKADYTAIVPACRGLHAWMHARGLRYFHAVYGIDLEAHAAATERAWQASQGRTDG